MKAQYVLDRVQDILQDTTGVRWPETELLRYLNDAQQEVVLQKPDASSENFSMQLRPGTRQVAPPNALRLLDVVRNMGLDGNTPGDAVTLIGRGVLDAQRRSWHSDPSTESVHHYIYDARDPKTFYVYPPVASPPHHLEVVVSTAPNTVMSADEDLSLDDIYINVLIDYVLYRSYSKDADFAANLERALTHYQAFAQSLGIKTKGDYTFTPRAARRDTRDTQHEAPQL